MTHCVCVRAYWVYVYASLACAYNKWCCALRLGEQYTGYDLERNIWWWEFVVLGRKVLMLAVVFMFTGPVAQVGVSGVACGGVLWHISGVCCVSELFAVMHQLFGVCCPIAEASLFVSTTSLSGGSAPARPVRDSIGESVAL